MKLGDVRPKLRTLSDLEEAPDIIVLHVGGNDLGQNTIGDLREIVKRQFRYIKNKFPNAKVIWSQILPRKRWRYSDNNNAMERSRVRLNSAAATEAIRLGGGYINT